MWIIDKTAEGISNISERDNHRKEIKLPLKSKPNDTITKQRLTYMQTTKYIWMRVEDILS